MYDEAEDFRSHAAEIAGLKDVLASVGIQITRLMTLLDVGGGQGMHVGYLAGLARHVNCADIVDYSSLYGGEFLKLLREKHERHGIPFELQRVAFHRTDAMRLFYRDGWFDGVVSINSFEHIPDPGKALSEMARVTKPGGFIYISTDPIWTADTGSHFFHRVPEPWAQLVHGDEAFAAKMRAAGAPEEEITEYGRAMNRWRADGYAREVERIKREEHIDVLQHDSWAGVADEAHRRHQNLGALLARGYTESELMIRGLRWVLRRR